MSRQKSTSAEVEKPEPKQKATRGPISLPELKRGLIPIYLWGLSPLIVHAWSKKARLEMLAKQMGQPLPKYAKSPVTDFLESLYRLDDGGYGFPATGIKKAAIEAATSMNKEITKVQGRQSFYIEAEQGKSHSAFANLMTPMQLVRVHSPNAPAMREDGVRLNGRTADLRYRAEFWPWAMKLGVVFNETVITRATVAALFDTAGFAVGVGEWRQERNGTYGQFRIADASEIRQIEKWAAAEPKQPTLPDEQEFLRQLNEDIRKYGKADEPTAEELYGLEGK